MLPPDSSGRAICRGALAGGRYVAWYAAGPAAATAAEAAWPICAFDPVLFTGAAHGRTQPGGANLHWFGLSDQLTGELVGRWLVCPDPADARRALSPGRAPFGGPQLAERLPLAVVTAFVAHGLAALADLGFRRLHQTLLPTAYAPRTSARVAEVLLAQQQKVCPDLTVLIHCRPVTAQPFEAGIAPAGRRRLRRLWAEGYTWQPEPAAALPAMLAELRHWRDQRGQPTSLTEQALTTLVAALPAAFPLLSVRHPTGARAAVTVAVWTTPTTLYYFLPASDPALATYSPAILLLAGMYDFCRAAGGHLLDLGPSLTPAGSLSTSLLRFKRSMGAVPSVRLTLGGPLPGSSDSAGTS